MDTLRYGRKDGYLYWSAVATAPKSSGIPYSMYHKCVRWMSYERVCGCVDE